MHVAGARFSCSLTFTGVDLLLLTLTCLYMQFFRDKCHMFTLNTRTREVYRFCGQLIPSLGYPDISQSICSVSLYQRLICCVTCTSPSAGGFQSLGYMLQPFCAQLESAGLQKLVWLQVPAYTDQPHCVRQGGPDSTNGVLTIMDQCVAEQYYVRNSILRSLIYSHVSLLHLCAG